MKWRKLLELCTSSSPPGQRQRRVRSARGPALFEALENRKLFAADLAEIATVELFSDTVMADVPIDSTRLEIDPAIEQAEIMMMTFRGSEVLDEVDPVTKSEEIVDAELGSPLMYMTGAVDLSATSDPVDDTTVDTTVDPIELDDTISPEDVIFYSLGSTPDVTSSDVVDSPLEDVNMDGTVTALDMLLVINALNSYGSMPMSQVASLATQDSQAGNWDINRDGFVTPLDALLLTNYFNHGLSINSVESSQDAFAATSVSRIRNPTDDASVEDTSVEVISIDQSAPLIEARSKDEEFWELD